MSLGDKAETSKAEGLGATHKPGHLFIIAGVALLLAAVVTVLGQLKE